MGVHSVFLNVPSTSGFYTLSLHDALPICVSTPSVQAWIERFAEVYAQKPEPEGRAVGLGFLGRSEEHTSELQSHVNLVCRLLLEKKKKTYTSQQQSTTS